MKKILIYIISILIIINIVDAIPTNINEYVLVGNPDVIYATETSHYGISYGVNYDRTVMNTITYLKLECPDGNEETYDVFTANKNEDIPIFNASYIAGGTINITSYMKYLDGNTWEVLASKRVDVKFEGNVSKGDKVGFMISTLTTAGSSLYLCDYGYVCTKGVDDLGNIEIERVGYDYITITGVDNVDGFTIMNDNVGKVVLDRVFGVKVTEMNITTIDITGNNITSNITGTSRYGTYWWRLETYDNQLIDRVGMFIQELTSQEIGKVVQFQPQGVYEAEENVWVENEWKFHTTEHTVLNNPNCSILSINTNNTVVYPQSYNYYIDEDEQKVVVKWFTNSTVIEEGKNYMIKCSVEVTVGGYEMVLEGLEQYIYINRGKGIINWFVALWNKLLGIEYKIDNVINNTINIENNTIKIIERIQDLNMSINENQIIIMEAIGNETNYSIKDILTRPVMSVVH